MYTTSAKMLADARAGGYAVGAFNFENMEMALAIVSAAEECRAPVILQTTPSTLKYGTPEVMCAIAKAAAAAVSVPVACHLDHGNSVELAGRCLAAGYSSLMIDGSKMPFGGNVAVTTQGVAFASGAGVPVEAELGMIGGKEDGMTGGDICTDPDTAVEFVRLTGAGSLAVAIGTAHGIYRGVPVLDTGRLSLIAGKLEEAGLSLPLVLHGASGLSDAQVTECVARGICKVNFATELRQAYTAAVREVLSSDTAVFDPKAYGKAAVAAVREQVKYRISVCGCEGKA